MLVENDTEADLQGLVNACGAALTLFYTLMFFRIGYCGMHTDYSVAGWPERHFRHVLPAKGTVSPV